MRRSIKDHVNNKNVHLLKIKNTHQNSFKMKILVIVILFSLYSIYGLCQDPVDFHNNHPGVHKVIVKEVIQTNNYTYLNTDENGKLQWIAVPKIEAAIDDIYYFQGGLEMKDFNSKELGRTFESVVFLNGLISPEIAEGGKTVLNQSVQMAKSESKKEDITINPAEGGITIGELLANKGEYASKVVRIRGQVIKYNSGILKKNWLHLQDGSGSSGDFDLTVTTDSEVKVNDIITVEGIITLDKDFGAGYFYSILMENARIIEK